MKHYKLLTPGPLTTTETVKSAMLIDHCTWDQDYMSITTEIRNELLKLAHCSEDIYTTVLMQGSGSFGVESVLASAFGQDDELLVLTNGAYGNRMADMAACLGLKHTMLGFPYDSQPDPKIVDEFLTAHPQVTMVAMVHCETTTGILNDIEAIARVVKRHGKKIFVDAMSSFGGMEIQVEKLNVDFLVSSANKCIQGVPGFSFIIAKKEAIRDCAGKARSLSLSLYDQWVEMEKGGKWRFTSPTHVVLAFRQALKELEEEGGIPARNRRFQANMNLLREKFTALGLEPYLAAEMQSPIISTFKLPRDGFSFKKMYDFVKGRGYAIYPGKLLDLETFRVGVIGEIYLEDMEELAVILGDYLAWEKRVSEVEGVIFDWAGTTVDYGCFAPVSAFVETFESIGITPTLEEVRRPMGALKRDHIKEMLGMERIRQAFEARYQRPVREEDTDQLEVVFRKKLMAGLDQHTELKPFVLEVSDLLKERGIKIGSTTGYAREMLDPVYESAKRQGYEPDSVVTPDETCGVGRPAPLMIERNLKLLGLENPQRVIKVGDTVSDILEGRNAGLYSIGIIEGSSIMGLSQSEYDRLSRWEKEQEISRVRQVYLDAGADQVILNLEEFHALLSS